RRSSDLIPRGTFRTGNNTEDSEVIPNLNPCVPLYHKVYTPSCRRYFEDGLPKHLQDQVKYVHTWIRRDNTGDEIYYNEPLVDIPPKYIPLEYRERREKRTKPVLTIKESHMADWTKWVSENWSWYNCLKKQRKWICLCPIEHIRDLSITPIQHGILTFELYHEIYGTKWPITHFLTQLVN